jgi:hypothetical protein
LISGAIDVVGIAVSIEVKVGIARDFTAKLDRVRVL